MEIFKNIMKKLLFYSFLFLSFNVLGQDNKILIGVNFSPEYSYRMLKSTGKEHEEINIDNWIKHLNETETGKFGYTTGINAIYNFSKLFGIEIGVQYSVKGYQTKWTDLIFMVPEPGLPDKYKHRYEYGYIDVPLKANFTFGENKLRYIATAGFATNFLIEEKTIFVKKFGNKTEEQTNAKISSHTNKFNISSIIGAGVEYKISDKVSVRAIPSFKFGLIRTYDVPYISMYLWSAGIDIGIFYGIK